MPVEEDHFKIPLGPNVRLRLTVAEEMRLDPGREIFTDELHTKYIAMRTEAERQLQSTLKGTVYADIGLCLLLFGRNIKIPGTEFGLQDIPAATEVLTVLASFSFLVLCQAFATSQCYLAIIEQFSNRKALTRGIDPDFLTYGDVFFHIYLKAFRSKMNSYGPDFFAPGSRYKIFYGTVTGLLIMSWFSILGLHCIVVGVGVWNSIGQSWLWWPFAGAMLLLHVTGMVMNIFIDFSFEAQFTEKLSSVPQEEDGGHTR